MTPGQEDPPDLAALRQAVVQHLTTAGGSEEIYGDIAQLIDAASDEGDEAAVLDALDLAGQIEPLCDGVHASLVRYAFARWNLFEGTGHHPLHPADRRLSLAFNADYAQYSMAVEQVKVA